MTQQTTFLRFKSFHYRGFCCFVANEMAAALRKIQPWVKKAAGEEMCAVCYTEVNGEYGPADLRMSCGCSMHYFCLVKHVRFVLGDRRKLQSEGGIACPNSCPGGTCAFKQPVVVHDFFERNHQAISAYAGHPTSSASLEAGGKKVEVSGGEDGCEKGYLISLADMDELLGFHDSITSSPQGQAALSVWLAEDRMDPSRADELFLSQAQVDTYRGSI